MLKNNRKTLYFDVAYITSGKRGLHSFTYKELELLEKNNVSFIICFTQFHKGNFIPNENWIYIKPTILSIILSFITNIFKNPLKYIKLMYESIIDNSFIHFLLANSFLYQTNNRFTKIHCQMGDHKLNIGYYLSKFTNKKLSTTVHAHELYAKEVYTNPKKILKLYNQCNMIFTISNFNKKLLIERLNISEDKIKVMYLYPVNFNDSLLYKKKILTVGNWFIKKGYDFLFKTIKELNRSDFILWVAGDYIESKTSINLNDLVKKYNLQDKVMLLGAQPKNIMDILFFSCDIFCLPSITDYYENGLVREREGIPVAIMEAMMWGKPVISTNHAGIPEVLPNHTFLVEENNIEQLKNLLNFLLDHHELYNEVGENNKKYVSNKFNESNVLSLVNYFKKNN